MMQYLKKKPDFLKKNVSGKDFSCFVNYFFLRHHLLDI